MSDRAPPELVACPDCDALQLRVAGAYRLTCWRCAALLGTQHDERLDRLLALSIAALVLFLIANLLPLVRLNLQGDVVTTSLCGAAGALWHAGMEPIAALVAVTTVLLPGVYIVAVCYISAGLLWIEHAGPRRLPLADLVLRATQHAQAWSMLEVFLVGALVAIVRLKPVALVDVRIALWSVAGLVLLLATLAGSFHPQHLWERLERAGGTA
jgi:paraquat-inducible protein A